ncbi:MAG: histidinol dehydrogenase [Oscillospiraceae bacterium]|nr:histidinol dehydrogenase [Oscillospiraceae bacterium]
MIPIYNLDQIAPEEVLARTIPQSTVTEAVREIIAAVRREGDKALLRYSETFNGVKLSSLEVSEEEFAFALRAAGPELKGALERAAINIRDFHSRQKRSGFVCTERPGIVTGQRVIPLERVGICVPGGAAPLASTVLMNAIPAGIAGCREIIMVTPAGPDGTVAPAVLAAAWLAGVHRVFKLGGAQAVAALAYGTESVPRVDKIVGPGGAYVSEAKRQVFGQVDIDMIAGPSEILIIADGKSDPVCAAADLLSQAEHDVFASPVLVTDSPALAEQVQREIEKQLVALPRQEIARRSIDEQGKIVVTPDLNKAVEVANALAPEHLELCVDEPFALLGRVRNAGSVFLGRSCPEAVGDYYAGANHTLPTSGTARFASPLSVDDFVKTSQFIYYSAQALAEAGPDIVCLAQAERLQGHANSITVRTEGRT